MARIERLNMPIGAGQGGPDTNPNIAPTPTKPTASATEQPGQLAPKPGYPGWRSPSYDPKREDYGLVPDEKSFHISVYDPKTGEVVARMPMIAGGAGGILGRGKKEDDKKPESPIKGLSQEKFDLLISNRIPFQQIQETRNYYRRDEDFARVIDEAIAKIQEREEAQRARQNPPSVAAEGSNTKEAGSGDHEEPPEGPRSPEAGDKEWELSPERGRWLCDEIVRLRTEFPYKERYKILDKEGRPYLKRLYKELQEYVDKICKVRHEKDPWDPKEAYKKIEEAQKKNPEVVDLGPDGKPLSEPQNEEPESQEQHDITVPESEAQSTEDAEYLDSLTTEEHQQVIAQLTALYEDDNTPANTLNEIRKTFAIYFREAKRKGLLQGADGLFNTIYQRYIQSGEGESDQIAAALAQTLPQVIENIKDFWRAERGDDPDVERLKGIWEPYARWAREVFRYATQDREPPDSLKEKGALTFVQQELDEGRETYWRPGSWAGYYTVNAKTPEQFRIAADSFLQMIRTGAIGKSPDEVYKHLQNFKEQLGSQGAVEVKAQSKKKETRGEKLTTDFMKELRLEFEALSYIFGADYSNETYNPKSYNQFMMAMALHEGPDRWVELYRSGQGMVAAFTDMFDRRSFMAIYNNPVGDRGELNVIAQHFMQDQIKEMAIERGIGIQLKDYNPEDNSPDSPIRKERSTKTNKKPDQERARYLRANLKRLGIYMSNEELSGLYEGFEDGNAHKSNYQEYVVRRGLDPEKLPDRLQKSVKLGEIQFKLDKMREDIRLGEIKTRKTAAEILKERDPKAYELYKAAYDQADANFETAFQMQGATGEKVRRGKGFFYIDRNIHVQVYQGLREGDDRSRKIGRILAAIKKGKKLDIFSWEVKSKAALKQAAELERICGGIKRGDQLNAVDLGVYNTALAAFRANLEQINSGQIDGASDKALQDVLRNSEEVFRNLYEGFDGNAHKVNYDKLKNLDPTIFDKLPRRLKMSVHYGAVQEELKNKKLDQLSKRAQLIYNSVADYQFYQTLSDEEKASIVDHMPGYLAESAVQYVVNRTKIQYADSPVEVRRQAVDKAREDAVRQIKLNGWEVKFKFPKIIFDAEGNVEGVGEGVDEIDLKTASDSILARYTTHTYWAYQPENRHMLLTDQIFEAAKRIRAGSRPEDEEEGLLATQLLLVDPTLNRVARVDGDLATDEITIMNAAVEESYQDRQQIVRDLYAAFLPKTGNRGKMRVGYNLEDWGGSIRFAMGARELAASQPARFARRLGAGIAFIPIEIDSMPAIWGQSGVTGAINAFADQMKKIAHQGVASQFGITKFIDQMKYGEQLRVALFGGINPETGKEQEGLYKKPTNNSEELNMLRDDETAIIENRNKDVEVKLLHAILKSFGRLDEVLKMIGTEASLVRNAQGVLCLKDKEIFLEDGSYNSEEIDHDNDTGTARHSEKIFYDHFIDWLLGADEGGGATIYPQEQWWYKYLAGPCMLNPKITRREWIFNKMFSG